MPEIEEREAARFNGYTWKEWLSLERRDRIDNVAYYRLSRLIDIHRDDAIAADTEARAARRALNGA